MHNARLANRRRLTVVLALAAVYMIVEVAAGFISGSLALLADAGHMFSDSAALGLSLFAAKLAEKPPGPQKTYGYYRTEVLAALANGSILIAVSIFIFFEAYKRVWAPPPVWGSAVVATALGGLLVNAAGLAVLHGGREENLNVRGAWLHVLTDFLGSVGALAAGISVWRFRWYWVDPAVSAFIGALVIYSAWRLVAESVSVLMESAPRGINVDDVREAILFTAGVEEVHDLHVWSITSGLDALSAHVVGAKEAKPEELLTALRKMLHGRFGIDHITIQMESSDFAGCCDT